MKNRPALLFCIFVVFCIQQSNQSCLVSLWDVEIFRGEIDKLFQSKYGQSIQGLAFLIVSDFEGEKNTGNKIESKPWQRLCGVAGRNTLELFQIGFILT